jgi:hypothetical protein
MAPRECISVCRKGGSHHLPERPGGGHHVIMVVAQMVTVTLSAVVLVVCLAGSARAADAAYYGGWGGGSWYPPSVTYNQVKLPYFALYPPVYYSQIVPRAYGQSPFAYPPVVPAPEEAGVAAASPPSPQPLRIVNPYVTQPGEVSKPTPSPPPAHVPLVVYPAGAMNL